MVHSGAVDTRARQQQRAWYVYDWAGSAFSTTVVTVFLGPYLTSVTENAADADGFVRPLGIAVRAGSFFPYVVSLSVLLTVVVLPLVGAVADRTPRKAALLAALAYAGATATVLLATVQGENYLLGGALFVVANVAFGASIVVYNAFLPLLATPEERDAVSSRGWAAGYLGGGLLLAANLALFTARDALGLSTADAARICLASAGVWWAVFTLVPALGLRGVGAALPPQAHTGSGLRQLRATLRAARGYPRTLQFLVAYLLYNDGVQTVIALATVYGVEELALGQSTLTSAILLVQLLAFAGALLLGRLAARRGAIRVIAASLGVWIAVMVVGFVLPARQPLAFFALAAVIGLVLGGTQALSRSVFSHLIPRGAEAEYFGLYEISERGTSWLGPLLFGLTFQVTGSYRAAILSLVVFFVAGLLALRRVDVRRGIVEAGNAPPALV